MNKSLAFSIFVGLILLTQALFSQPMPEGKYRVATRVSITCPGWHITSNCENRFHLYLHYNSNNVRSTIMQQDMSHTDCDAKTVYSYNSSSTFSATGFTPKLIEVYDLRTYNDGWPKTCNGSSTRTKMLPGINTNFDNSNYFSFS